MIFEKINFEKNISILNKNSPCHEKRSLRILYSSSTDDEFLNIA